MYRDEQAGARMSRFDTPVLDEIRNRVELSVLVSEMGVELRRSGTEWCGLCPFHSERTPSFNANDAKQLWFCHGCGVGGDAFEFMMKLQSISFRDAVKALADRVGIQVEGDAVEPPPVKARARVKREHLPREVIDAIARQCIPVTDDADVCSYLEGRKIDPYIVAHFKMAFALRRDADHEWARYDRRLVCPMYDCEGVRRSVIGRLVREPRSKREPKAMMLAGATSSGLLMACPFGLRLLRGEPLPPPAVDRPLIVIAEGEPDAMTFRSHTDATAVFGVRPGAWTPELAARLPDGAKVLVATHHDEPGERYAAKIVRTLEERATEGKVEVLRWEP